MGSLIDGGQLRIYVISCWFSAGFFLDVCLEDIGGGVLRYLEFLKQNVEFFREFIEFFVNLLGFLLISVGFF